VVRDGEVMTRAEERSRMDSSIKGYKKALKQDEAAARAKADRIIKSTYRTLMSRGQKGCYVYCTDEETAAYFERMAEMVEVTDDSGPVAATVPSAGEGSRFPGLPLRVLADDEVVPFEDCVPIFDLEAAAGGFVAQDPENVAWVELPAAFRAREGQFVARVVGESMNRRIPNGAWCLFGADGGGSRQGKIVLVELRDVVDPESGGRYTVKRYESEKVVSEEGWRHAVVRLRAESTVEGYEDLVFEDGGAGAMRVVGLLEAVLG
jgi:phage repressor protein C with HTH and peptisase S24 domain